MYMLMNLFTFLLLIFCYRDTNKNSKMAKGNMFLPVQFLVMRMDRERLEHSSLLKLQLRHGIINNRPAEGKNCYHVRLPAPCSALKIGG